MPMISVKRRTRRLPAAIALCLALSGLCSLSLPALASASTAQIAIFQDGAELTNPQATLLRIRELGATTVRVFVSWAHTTVNPLSAKAPSNFNAADPNAYPDSSWAPLDAVVRDAKRYGMTVDFTVAGGAPVWAEGSGIPPGPGAKDLNYAWKPSASAYGQFVRAVGERYGGAFRPHGVGSALPAVRFWAIWNEANFGEDLGPQAIAGSSVSVAPNMYRGLLNAGWSALNATGHGHDTILIGEYAARGITGRPTKHAPQGYPGNYGQTKPLIFIRTLYCVDSSYQQLRGSIAKSEGCPTNAAGSRKFRSQNPGLFNASGVGDHPYPINLSPVSDGRADPDFAAFPDLGNLARVLDRTQRVYASNKKLPIYSDEYGYITHPPASAQYVSPSTAAYYLNWAEYLSYKNPRIKSYMQYLLFDPPGLKGQGNFASGLLTTRGAQKQTYGAYRLPLYMPLTTFKHGQTVEVWGDVRPAGFMTSDTQTAQQVQIQLQSGSRGAFKTINTVKISSQEGYFDIHMKFPSSGTVRLVWTYPPTDPLLPAGAPGATVYSRHVVVKVR